MTIIVPYRDRAYHLSQFIPHIKDYLPDATIVVVEQCDTKDFNRGKLLNIGFLNYEDDYYCFHDVDKLPVIADYSFPKVPRQIAPNPFQTQSYFGGVTLFNSNDFTKVEGYHNDFWGWGGEDNELMFQLIRKKVTPEFKFGSFVDLPHPRPKSEFEMAKWKRAQQPRKVNMLLTCKYELLSIEEMEAYIHIKVLL